MYAPLQTILDKFEEMTYTKINHSKSYAMLLGEAQQRLQLLKTGAAGDPALINPDIQ